MGTWKDSLVEYFIAGEKENCGSMLGVEVEHFIVDPIKRRAVEYSGEAGVRNIISDLIKRYPDAVMLEEDDLFGYSVPDFNITIEPAAQLEISIIPLDSISSIGKIYSEFMENLNDIISDYGYEAVNTGCQPYSRVEDIELIPKPRYKLMDDHFRDTGTGGMEMMRGTASLQISVDYSSETDFRRKMQAAYYYSPFFKLFCDCSPYFQGKPLDISLKRTDIWRRVDPSRCGILPGVFSSGYGFEDYADFIGGSEPIFIKKGKEIRPTGRRTVDDLFKGKQLDRDLTEHLLSMVFPDVRLKNFLEIRCADSVQYPFIMAYCALIKGLILSESGLEYAGENIRSLGISEGSVISAENALMEQGWKASVYGMNVRDEAMRLIDLAKGNIEKDEADLLDIFISVAEYGGISNMPLNAYPEL